MKSLLSGVRWTLASWGLFLLCAGCSPGARRASGLLSDDVSVRREAAAALCVLGRRARGAGSELVRTARDPDDEIRRLSIEALGNISRMDREVSDAIILGMSDESVDVRRAAVASIGRFRRFPSNAMPSLRRKLRDHDKLVRDIAIGTFQDMGSYGVHALATCLRDTSVMARRCAAEGLGGMGPEAEDALGALRRLSKDDPDGEVRRLAAAAVDGIVR